MTTAHCLNSEVAVGVPVAPAADAEVAVVRVGHVMLPGHFFKSSLWAVTAELLFAGYCSFPQCNLVVTSLTADNVLVANLSADEFYENNFHNLTAEQWRGNLFSKQNKQ